MKQHINEIKRMQQLAGILKENKLNEDLNIHTLPLDTPALGLLWRLATPEDDVYDWIKYVWIEDNVHNLLTQLYKSLGEKDDAGIREVVESLTADMSPIDSGNINMTVGEFLEGIIEEYEEFGL